MSDEDNVIPGQSWVMCNVCCRSALSSSSHVAFYLTRCGHIFCNKCLVGFASSRDLASTCLFCKKKTAICRIDRRMPEAVQTYFRCPRELLAESMVEIMQVVKFQTMHAASLVKRFNIMRINYEKLRRFCCEILQKKAILERELISKGELLQHNNMSVNNGSTPFLQPTSSAKNLHAIRSVETSKTSVASESMSKSGAELPVVGNSVSPFSESTVEIIDVAKTSVENSSALPTSYAN